jgi:hypothetical protein
VWKLVRREYGLHEFDAFNVREAGHMVKVGWIGVGADLLMNLEGCLTVELPSVEYVGGSDCSKSLKSFGQKGDRSGGSPGILSSVGFGSVCECGDQW